MDQQTPEWHLARLGYATASRFKDILARTASGAEAAGRRDYRFELAVERLTGIPAQTYQNEAMRWGSEMEAQARLAFEEHTGLMVEESGFIPGFEMPWTGCSPDGLIGLDEGLEIKCPFNPAIHIQTFLSGMPSTHRAQVQGSLWITDRRRWHFVSYDPRMPPHLRIYHQVVLRDDVMIERLIEEVGKFLREVERLLADLEDRGLKL